MKHWGRVEIGMIATVSTAHLPPAALASLEEHSKSPNLTPEHEWYSRVHIASSRYGYGLNASSLANFVDGESDVPPFLRETSRLCSELNLAWIFFDQDADEIDGLPAYEH